MLFNKLNLSDLIQKVLEQDDEIKQLAIELYQQRSVIVMGRGYNYATCLEGALVIIGVWLWMNLIIFLIIEN